MKKIIAILLLVVMCFSLVACGNKAEKEIVGEWKYSNADGSDVSSFIFYKDGTGTTDYFSEEADFNWRRISSK